MRNRAIVAGVLALAVALVVFRVFRRDETPVPVASSSPPRTLAPSAPVEQEPPKVVSAPPPQEFRVPATEPPAPADPPPAVEPEDPLAPTYRPVDGMILLDIQPSEILRYQGRIYVASFQDEQILVFDEQTGKPLHRFKDFLRRSYKLPKRDETGKVIGEVEFSKALPPSSLTIAGGRLFAIEEFGDSLVVFDPGTMRLITRLKIGKPSGTMVASPDGGTLYLACNEEPVFYTIDPQKLTMSSTPYPKETQGIADAVVTPDGKRLYLALHLGARPAEAEPPPDIAGPVNPIQREEQGGGLLAVYDFERKQYVALKGLGDTHRIRVPHEFPHHYGTFASRMTFDAEGRTLFIGMSQCMAGVHIYDLATERLDKPILFPVKNKYFRWPNCKDVLVHGGKLYVAVNSNRTIVVLDAHTRKVEREIPLVGDDDNDVGPMCLGEGKLYVCLQNQRRIAVLDVR
jgi:DNA-binding beta-propeller fold protein YncE